MAASATHIISIGTLNIGSSPQASPSNEIYRQEVANMSATELQAVQDFVDLIHAGTDVSSVVTAIDLL